MRNFKRAGFVVFFLLLVLMLLAFVLENQQSVSLLFLGWAGPQLPVSLIVVLALLAGMIVGPLIRGILRIVPRVSRKRPV
ncbi:MULTISPECIES: lipopolysaccharide assembly protein LapA domain-containing protein [Pseudomonas]|nr:MULTISPECIES: lipopolysaccharide assembly protein LapA domain-containing protein [Pseudomonas]MBL0793596.1 LapA family protein [Pseudomonas sp. B7]MBX8625630.1 lipopolysaccharide assembly protein LapA domain-containing protein [Pseudomonas glycinae]MBY9025376.1 lipopolysaccharide assembly protein LapA domain-containing protein [Pseudomonas fluorescens]MBY9031770.1 lipopolysaccharide assembly protein LapA domain-containing protein [Pseudomonas fluorescens]MBY9037228.1 lipopolysaccharide asse